MTQRINTILGIAVVVFIFSTIFLSNYIVSQKYRFEVMKRRLDQIQTAVNSSAQDSGKQEDIKSLLSFAQKKGMVEAKEVYSLYQDSGIALSRLDN